MINVGEPTHRSVKTHIRMLVQTEYDLCNKSLVLVETGSSTQESGVPLMGRKETT